MLGFLRSFPPFRKESVDPEEHKRKLHILATLPQLPERFFTPPSDGQPNRGTIEFLLAVARVDSFWQPTERQQRIIDTVAEALLDDNEVLIKAWFVLKLCRNSSRKERLLLLTTSHVRVAKFKYRVDQYGHEEIVYRPDTEEDAFLRDRKLPLASLAHVQAGPTYFGHGEGGHFRVVNLDQQMDPRFKQDRTFHMRLHYHTPSLRFSLEGVKPEHRGRAKENSVMFTSLSTYPLVTPPRNLTPLHFSREVHHIYSEAIMLEIAYLIRATALAVGTRGLEEVEIDRLQKPRRMGQNCCANLFNCFNMGSVTLKRRCCQPKKGEPTFALSTE